MTEYIKSIRKMVGHAPVLVQKPMRQKNNLIDSVPI